MFSVECSLISTEAGAMNLLPTNCTKFPGSNKEDEDWDFKKIPFGSFATLFLRGRGRMVSCWLRLPGKVTWGEFFVYYEGPQ